MKATWQSTLFHFHHSGLFFTKKKKNCCLKLSCLCAGFILLSFHVSRPDVMFSYCTSWVCGLQARLWLAAALHRVTMCDYPSLTCRMSWLMAGSITIAGSGGWGWAVSPLTCSDSSRSCWMTSVTPSPPSGAPGVWPVVSASYDQGGRWEEKEKQGATWRRAAKGQNLWSD